MNQTEPTPTKSANSLATAVIFALIAAALTLPWNMFLESLRKDNPQLSESMLVKLLPFWLMIFVYGIVKNRKKKS